MFGIIITGIATFFEEMATAIGKYEISERKESVYTMGFLNMFWGTLIFFGIALVVISIWNVWTFQTIANGGIMDAQAVTAPPIFDRPLLDSARTIIENRAVEEAKYKIDVYHYTDPSQ